MRDYSANVLIFVKFNAFNKKIADRLYFDLLDALEDKNAKRLDVLFIDVIKRIEIHIYEDLLEV